jgi:hypothetical protein
LIFEGNFAEGSVEERIKGQGSVKTKPFKGFMGLEEPISYGVLG